MEPERKIEKLMRAVANKRREQAGDALELSPAARRQLQQEVSRRGTATRGGGFWSSLFSGFAPRLAFGLGVLAIVGVGLWLFLPLSGKQKPATLALNGDFDKAPAAARRQMVAAPTVSEAPAEKEAGSAPAAQPAPPGVAMEDRLQSGIPAEAPRQVTAAESATTQAITSTAKTTSPPQPVNAPVELFDTRKPSGTFTSAGSLDKDSSANRFGPMPPMMVTNAVTSGVTVATAEPEAQKKLDAPQTPVFYRATRSAASDAFFAYQTTAPGTSATQRFRRTVVATTPHAAGTGGTAPVLASFQVVLNGTQISVVDADGSVYTGSLSRPTESSAPATAISGRSASSPVLGAKTEASPRPSQNYWFRVVGTNRYLNENIIFSGNLIPITNFPLPQTNAAAAGEVTRLNQEIPDASVLSNSRISGRVIIGGQKEVEVNAAPAR